MTQVGYFMIPFSEWRVIPSPDLHFGEGGTWKPTEL